MSRQCLHAAAVVLAAALLWGPPPVLAQSQAQAAATAPAGPPPADTTATDPNKPGDNKPADAQAADQAGKAGEDEAHIKLPGATVQGKRNAFDENDRKLKELQDSLPCAGCDAKPHTHKKLYKRVLDAVGDRVLPTEAPDHATHDANDKSLEFSQEGNCSGANVKQCMPSNATP